MKQGVINMNSIVTVLRVFRNSTLITPQGEFKISRIFPTGKAAKKARYVFYGSYNGVLIYTQRIKKDTNKFAVIST
jgi:hypothetical protein